MPKTMTIKYIDGTSETINGEEEVRALCFWGIKRGWKMGLEGKEVVSVTMN